MHASEDGVFAIKQREGFFARPYRDSVGMLTIGYGTISNPLIVVLTKDMACTREQADTWLRKEIALDLAKVKDLVKVPLTQGQIDVLASFVYNLGVGSLAKSTLLRRLNRGEYDAVPSELIRWNKGRNPNTGLHEPILGLTRRRESEGAQWRAATPRRGVVRAETSALVTRQNAARVPTPTPTPTPTNHTQVLPWFLASVAASLAYAHSVYGNIVERALSVYTHVQAHIWGYGALLTSLLFGALIGVLTTRWAMRRRCT